MDTSSKRLYTADEVAELFGCGRRTVMSWASSGLLPRVRVGGITRYRAEDLERLISRPDEEKEVTAA
jgi:excisionase family DNA binding protein